MFEGIVEYVEVVWNGNIAFLIDGNQAEKRSMSLKDMSDENVVAIFQQVRARGIMDFFRVKFELKPEEPDLWDEGPEPVWYTSAGHRSDGKYCMSALEEPDPWDEGPESVW